MRIQTGVLVPLGYGKYVRLERVAAIMPIEEERGRGRRTFVFSTPRTNVPRGWKKDWKHPPWRW